VKKIEGVERVINNIDVLPVSPNDNQIQQTPDAPLAAIPARSVSPSLATAPVSVPGRIPGQKRYSSKSLAGFLASSGRLRNSINGAMARKRSATSR
jgi:hypothetical protein